MESDSNTSTAVLDDRRDRDIRAFKITVLSGPDAERTFHSTGERTVIGSHPSADLVLSDRTVSRFHCEIAVDEHGAIIRDLDSRNGTRMENLAIRSARLEGAVIFKVGQTELRFELVTETIAVPLAPSEQLHGLVGTSSEMRSAMARLAQGARTKANILIEGESGTGKGVAAAAVHEESERSGGPFGVVDCSLPEAALRHELFGKEASDEPGAFELCDGGTLVLDNVGAADPGVQVDLLRAIDDGTVVRTDGGRKRQVDVRVVATTRRNLRRDVNAGQFKTALFNLIAVIRVRLPPLKERLTDIPLLIAAILEELDATGTAAAAELTSGVSIERLRGHSWPDNVRELHTYVERCIAMDDVIAPEDDAANDEPPVIDPSQPIRQAREEWVRYFERSYLARLLEQTGQNVSAAARVAKVDRVHMHRLLSKAGLR